MKRYPAEHWKALGDWVSRGRHQAGYSDTKKWAEAVGRSTRMLLGLERGEPVGAKTIEAISEVLGVSNWSIFEILERGQVDWFSATPAEIEDARARYEAETGLEADDGERSSLAYVSDEDLLSEIARRLSARPLSRTERRVREIDLRWGDPQSAPDEPDRPALDTHFVEGVTLSLREEDTEQQPRPAEQESGPRQ